MFAASLKSLSVSPNSHVC